MKVLISAYACEPGKGSEPGIGWNVARHLADLHDVWVITRANNRRPIEQALATNPVPRMNFAYYDLPSWMRWWKRRHHGVRTYYYLWQIGAHRVARRLHREIHFDVAQHVTFQKYWAPSFLALLPVPFVWGPVGGGESAPRALWAGCGVMGLTHEVARTALRWIAEQDPLVRFTARRCAAALAVTKQTADRVSRIGATRTQERSGIGLADSELAQLRTRTNGATVHLRFLSVGNLLHWKGFHLGLRAFAAAGLPDCEYWIVGQGPERQRLTALVESLGIRARVRFWGQLPRGETLRRQAECDVLVHPSLHDSGGIACLEAMAAGLPIVCLDLGGPGCLVTDQTGIKVPPRKPSDVIADLAAAMCRLAADAPLRQSMGMAATQRIHDTYRWDCKARETDELYRQVVVRHGGPAHTRGPGS